MVRKRLEGEQQVRTQEASAATELPSRRSATTAPGADRPDRSV